MEKFNFDKLVEDAYASKDPEYEEDDECDECDECGDAAEYEYEGAKLCQYCLINQLIKDGIITEIGNES